MTTPDLRERLRQAAQTLIDELSASRPAGYPTPSEDRLRSALASQPEPKGPTWNTSKPTATASATASAASGVGTRGTTAIDPLPPGPYRIEWPAEQGGWFTVWGGGGWAVPLVALGPQSVMEWLADHLNRSTPTRDETGLLREALDGIAKNADTPTFIEVAALIVRDWLDDNPALAARHSETPR